MASGSITVRVRPLRVAFLVDPSDREGVFRAIELSTYLWGGAFNPLIPAYRRTPRRWDSHRVRRLPPPSEIVDGYLNGFDPDLVVAVGVCAGRQFLVGNRDQVKADELVGDLERSGSPKFGIGLIEVLRDFVEKELKFKRNDALEVLFPELPTRFRIFHASVFGALSTRVRGIIDKHFGNLPGVTRPKVDLSNFAEMLAPQKIFPRRLGSWMLEQPLHDAQLFVCDASSTSDVIDYWNLRAAGYYVIPIPIQAANVDGVKTLARDFINGNYRPYRDNPNIYHRTTIQRSRSLSEEVVNEFCQSLQVPPSENKGEPKYMVRWWYPRIWDPWARENTSEGISFPHSHEEEIRIPEAGSQLDLRSEDPKFALLRDFSGNPKFANEFSFQFYGTKEPMAEVFPEGGRELSSAIGRTGYHNWRFSRFGPVFLADHEQDLIFLELPRAEAVMTEWFRERGWKISLSAPGRIAAQLLKQLGGAWGITWLAHKGIIELLGELEDESGTPRQAVIESLKRVIATDKLHFEPERFLERLLEAKAIRLGTRVQCPVCTRHNWYELSSLEYDLRCRFCLSDYPAPAKSPGDMVWTYRAHGPFARSVAQGAFTVLLTLKFLTSFHRPGVTPLFSYTAEKDSRILEADLTCLYRPTTWRESRTYLVHAECKSFNRFKPRDFERMRSLADEFPGCALIFATLNYELNSSDVRRTRSMSIAERRKRLRGKPNSPVIVLTGTELFSMHGAPNCWRGKGGPFDKMSEGHKNLSDLSILADATQQLYLQLPPWHEWADAEWKKRRKQITPPQAASGEISAEDQAIRQ